MYQNTVVVGHLGRDPEMKYTQDGTPVTSFSIATTRKWTGKDGQPAEETTWFRVAVWGKLGETCNQYLSKGRLVLVEGTISASAYKSREGEARASLELRASTVRFLGGHAEGEAKGDATGPAVSMKTEEEIPF